MNPEAGPRAGKAEPAARCRQTSAGCGKQGRPSGGTVTVANDHIYTFPESYDGTKPFPLFIGFHACGNPIDQFLNLTRGSKFETEYVRAFPRSSDSGGCWNYGSDIARVTRVYDELMSNYCIDKNRVFGAGHSSGAQMIVQILTHKNDAAHIGFKARLARSSVGLRRASRARCRSSTFKARTTPCAGKDGAPRGPIQDRECVWHDLDAVFAVTACQSSGKTVNPGCVSYDG